MGLELDILNWIQNLHSPVVDFIMILITAAGNIGAIWIIMTIIYLIIPAKRKSGIVMAVALAIESAVCNLILKNLFMRIRPFDINTAVELLIAKPRDFSFPSGHTAASFAVVAVLFWVKDKRVAVLSLILAVLIAFSRMYLYVHYPTDVAGGILLGVLSGSAAFFIVSWIRKRRDRKREKRKIEE